jgi:hypothetical protein
MVKREFPLQDIANLDVQNIAWKKDIKIMKIFK